MQIAYRKRHAVRALWFACLALTAGSAAGLYPAMAAGPDYVTPGLSAEQLARLPGVSFARPLQDPPARNLVVLHLDFSPKHDAAAAQPACSGRRYPGPATMTVTKGAVRLGLGGRPAQIVHAGETVYLPARILRAVEENASGVEAAAAFVVVAVPKGAAILTADNNCGPRPAH